jgi:hypothetical protein
VLGGIVLWLMPHFDSLQSLIPFESRQQEASCLIDG